MGRESSSPVDEPTGDETTAPWSEGRSGASPTARESPTSTLAATPIAISESGSAADDLPPDDLVGKTLGGSFTILRIIGEGGTGRVYEAQHTRIGMKRFAVKVLHAEYLRHPEAWVRFQREAEAAASIDHPKVVTVYDVDRTEDGRPYLVYEYLEGVELGSLLRQKGTLPPRAAARIVQEICQALAAAHEKGVIHRDVKPQNVWLMGDLDEPAVKILDFGLSRLRDDDGNSVTKTGAVLGTPAYMSPEQARGERVDTQSDVYGAGTVLYATLTGRPPFDEENVQRTLLSVMSREPTRPRTLVPIISEGLELVVQRAMAKDPAERYATVEELAEALEPFTERPAHRSSGRPPLPSVLPGGDSRRQLVGAIFATFLMVPALALSLIVGVASALDRRLGDLELVLLTVALVGTALTPLILWLRRVRRTVWENTVRVQDLSRRLLGTVVGALLGYGLAALSVRLLDATLDLGAGTRGADWGPFDAIFAVVALLSGAAASVIVGARARHWTVRVVAPLTAFTVGGIVALGVMWRSDQAVRAVAEVGLSEAPGIREEDTERLAAQVARAPEKDLAAAVTKGLKALRALRREYPGDPAVVHALAMALGSNDDFSEALRQIEKLCEMDPAYGEDRSVRALVQKAMKHRSSREAALTIAASRMGSAGLDMLYELMLENRDLRPKIEKLFESPDLQARFSPSLAVAYNLLMADSCSEWASYLEEAARVGDERAVVILAPLAKRERRCGIYRNQPCEPTCPDEAKAIVQTLHKIRTRINP